MLLAAVVTLFALHACADLQEIVDLPGAPPVSFKQYGGYFDVDSQGRKLYGMFVEAESQPASAPLSIWLTGGPGCSSLLAWGTENGPFRPLEGGKSLRADPYSWNKVSNMIFLESPAGVGFSKVASSSGLVVGDVRTANDTYTWLQGFFRQFPQYQSNDFWVTGESYGGHYVPELTERIAVGNDGGAGIHINLRGFAVGNAWTDILLDNTGTINSWKHRGIVSIEAVDAIEAQCNLSWVGPLRKRGVRDACDDAVDAAMNQMGDINIYEIYADVCPSASPQAKQLAKYNRLTAALVERHERSLRKRDVPFPPNVCVNNFLSAYLNRADVQQAIHADPTRWSECSDTVQYSHADLATSVIPVYQRLLERDLHLLVLSGDVDGIVAYEGTSYWLPKLGLKVVKPWRQWLDETKNVGGYYTEYEKNFGFTTVRNAGHEVPTWQPARSLQLISDWFTYQTIRTN